MSSQTDEPHILLGAYVLGGLSDEDHRVFKEHLRSCQECRHEYDQAVGIPRLLDLLDPVDVDRLLNSRSAGGSSWTT